MAKEVAEKGDTIKVNYTGSYENGEVFDSSIKERAKGGENFDEKRKYGPLVVKLGERQLITGFEKALLGMKKSDEKKVLIPPEEAYGHFDAALVQNIPRDSFKKAGIEPKIGQLLNTDMGICKVVHVDSKDIEVDFNSPMAGKTLVFEIKVEEIMKE
jgi:FKBP-type peptidyl-prolyl cis-trans isomerase 2